MAKGKTKGAAKRRAHVWHIKRKRQCAAFAVRAYYKSAAKRAMRRWDVLDLHADLQAWTGHNADRLAADTTCLVWLAIDGAYRCGFSIDGRSAHYLLRGVDALVMVRERPKRLQVLRKQVIDAITVLRAMRDHITQAALADADRSLWLVLRTRGYVGTQDIANLFRRRHLAVRGAA